MLCLKQIDLRAMGRRALTSHAMGKAHTNRMNAQKDQGKIFFPSNAIEKTPKKDSAVRGELRLVIFFVEHNIPLHVLDHSNVIEKICTDSEIAKKMEMKRTKGAYLLNDALAPLLKTSLTENIREKPFSISIDESNEMGHRKFLEMVISFVDEAFDDVVHAHFDICEIPDGKAETIFKCVKEKLESAGLPLNHLLSCMTDSPAVMVGQKKGFLTLLKKVAPHVIDIGRCSLHHVANAVKYACETLGRLVEEFADDVFNYFQYTSRWTSYTQVTSLLELPAHRYLRRVETRWVQLLIVVGRLLEQLPALQEFFLVKLPRDRMKDLNNACVIRIRTALQNPMLELHLTFLKSSLSMADKFEKQFQRTSCEITKLVNFRLI